MAQASTIQKTEFITGEILLNITLILYRSGLICGHQILHATSKSEHIYISVASLSQYYIKHIFLWKELKEIPK